ncbi:hypothetical protein K450DRAFT_247479 [Umbelopsis ramanniana AG]|uniref:ALIX V-shaped domain-containing protein n=1 Tax=Umbelopsis ramanniana AG TaxID=1314678 RepID=A0AAD5E7I2_UMBRA|nr:uncharacterized protein K450DRAFT_247479 [Umbelopsis ramanniana AG]KAI8578347.1 hypothetical protein K450DRAFT_247479 [Umbelopsis ramanniana AG]
MLTTCYRKGIQFYSNLTDVIETLLRNTQNFANSRAQERDDLVVSIDSSKSQMEQQMLKEKLSKYDSGPSAPHDASIYQLADRTRQMDLNHAPPAPHGSAPPLSPTALRSPPSLPPQPQSLYNAYTAAPSQPIDQHPVAPPPLPPTQRSNSMASGGSSYGYQSTPSPYGAAPQLPPNSTMSSGYRSYGNVPAPTSPVYQRPAPYQPPPSTMGQQPYRQEPVSQAPPIPGNPPPPVPPQPNYSQGQYDYHPPPQQPYSPARPGSYSSTPSTQYHQYGYMQQQAPPAGYGAKPPPPIPGQQPPQTPSYSTPGYQSPAPQAPYGGYSSYVPQQQPPPLSQGWNQGHNQASPQWQQQQPAEHQPYPGQYHGGPPPAPQQNQPYWPPPQGNGPGGNSLMD